MAKHLPLGDNMASKIEETSDTALDLLALHLLNHGVSMPEKEMRKTLEAWRDNPNTILATVDESAHRAVSASNVSSPRIHDPQLAMMLQQTEQRGDKGICAHKGKVFGKFNALLQRLGAEKAAMLAHEQEATESWKQRAQRWLEVEKQYRLRVQELEEAEAGAKVAADELATWKLGTAEAKTRKEQLLAAHERESQFLAKETRLTKYVDKKARYIDKYKNQPATVKRLTKKLLKGEVKLKKVNKETKVEGATERIDFLEKETRAGKVADDIKQIRKTTKELLDRCHPLGGWVGGR